MEQWSEALSGLLSGLGLPEELALIITFGLWGAGLGKRWPSIGVGADLDHAQSD